MKQALPSAELLKEIGSAGLETRSERKKLADIEFKTKGDDSPVTHLDEALDRRLREIIMRHFPDDVIISEENANLERPTPQQAVWWIDPIDGTKEFIRGAEEWVLQLARSQNGQLQMGILFQPATESFYFAARGAGCFSQSFNALKAGEPAKALRLATKNANWIAIASRSRANPAEENLIQALGIQQKIQRGSLGLKAVAIATGEADFYPNLSGLSHLWDLAAPQIVLEEAGGKLFLRQDAPDYSGQGETKITASYALCHPGLVPKLSQVML